MNRNKDWMLIGTWIIAVSAVATTIISAIYYQKQVNEMRMATKLEWRPYLNVEYIDRNYKFRYLFTSTRSDSMMPVPMFNLKTTDPSFKDLKGLYLRIAFKTKYRNRGKTPLRVMRHVDGLLTSKQWENVYQKSELRLMDSVLVFAKDYTNDIDLIIQPDTNIASWNENYLSIIFNPDEIDILKTPKQNTIYLYSFVEYEDFLGNKYNTLFVEYNSFAPQIDSGYLQYSNYKIGIEKYRMDIDL
jgi:hypothetical protein